MFVPIHDDNPLRHVRFQYVTLGLIVINFAVFAWQSEFMQPRAAAAFGVVPARLLFGFAEARMVALPYDPATVPPWITLISYMFFHGDIWHVQHQHAVPLGVRRQRRGRAWALQIPVFLSVLRGDRGSHARRHAADPTAPLIGASGAVAGVIAAYVLLYPRVRVWVLVFRFIPLNITAGFAIGAWILSQLVMVILPQPEGAVMVAWWAHLGGLIAGAGLILLLRRPGVKLLM